MAASNFGNMVLLLISSGSMFASQPMNQLNLSPTNDLHNVSETNSFLEDIPSECHTSQTRVIPPQESTHALVTLPLRFTIAFGMSPVRCIPADIL